MTVSTLTVAATRKAAISSIGMVTDWHYDPIAPRQVFATLSVGF